MEKQTILETEQFKVMKRQNLKGKNRHATIIELIAIDKTTGKRIELEELPEAVKKRLQEAIENETFTNNPS